MQHSGYVYILINPSMDGMVKIGKTNRDPMERAKELSASTGVPTPFISVYNEYFDDCTFAEKYIHNLLEQKGYRVADNREFFEIPIKDAIQLVLETKTAIDNSDQSDPNINKDTHLKTDHWKDTFALAEQANFGLEDEFIDIGKAIKLYKQAITLGGNSSYIRLGDIYQSDENYKNFENAIKYYQEGALKGQFECYIRLSEVYLQTNEISNALKCWNKIFGFIEEFSDEDIAKYGFDYISQHISDGLPLEHINLIKEYKNKIRDYCDSLINFDSAIFSWKIIRYKISKLLFGENPTYTHSGKIKWFEKDKGYGFISQVVNDDVFLPKDALNLDDNDIFINEGQTVEFVLEYAEKGPVATAAKLLLTGEESQILQEEPLFTHSGTINWYNSKEGYGSISNTDGKDVFLYKDSIINSTSDIYNGQPVDYIEEPGELGPMASLAKLK